MGFNGETDAEVVKDNAPDDEFSLIFRPGLGKLMFFMKKTTAAVTTHNEGLLIHPALY